MTGDRITAIHESAHATIAMQFGFDVRRVLLHRPGARVDEAGRCETSSWRQDLNADPVRALCYLLAGAAGERRLSGRTSSRDATDRAQAATVASVICEVDDESHPRVRALMHAAETMALGLMYDPVVWTAIERVAAALERKRELSGRDVALVLREACKR